MEKMKEINNLRNKFHEGSEFTILEFSNLLQSLGYEDICDNGNLEEILQSESIVINPLFEGMIIIEYMLVEKHENILDNVIVITDIEEF